MSTRLKLAAAAAAFLGIGALTAPQAKAILAITVDTSLQPAFTIFDNGLGDLNPVVGAVTFLEAGIGGLQFDVTTGNGPPSIGSFSAPVLRIDSSGATGSSPPSNITVQVSENNLTTTGPASVLLSADAIFPLVDSVPLSTAVYTYYLDNSNTLFGTGAGTQIGSLTLTNTAPAQSANTTVLANPDGSYSLTTTIVLTGVDAQSGFQVAAGIAVPEPASLALFGASLLGLGLFGRRRRA